MYMIKKRAKLLKSRIKSLLRENRRNIVAAAGAAATALAPKIEEKDEKNNILYIFAAAFMRLRSNCAAIL
jgi:hypothetical protein